MIFSEDDFLCFSTEINASAFNNNVNNHNTCLVRGFFIDKIKLSIQRNYRWREMKVKIS